MAEGQNLVASKLISCDKHGPEFIWDEASSSGGPPVLTLWALGSNLVLTGELCLVGVQGNSGSHEKFGDETINL